MHPFDKQDEHTIDDLVDAIQQRIIRQSMPTLHELSVAESLLSNFIQDPADLQVFGRSVCMKMALDVADPLNFGSSEATVISQEDSDRDALVLLRAETQEAGPKLRQAFDSARKIYSANDDLQLTILAEAILARAALSSYSLSEGDLRLNGAVMIPLARIDGHIAFLDDMLELHRILTDINEVARGERKLPASGQARMRYLQEGRNAFRFLADHLCAFGSWTPMLSKEHCIDAGIREQLMASISAPTPEPTGQTRRAHNKTSAVRTLGIGTVDDFH